MGIALLIISLVFLLFAIIFSKGKGAALVSGFNAMPDDEKAKYDEEALCKFISKGMFGISISVFLIALSEMVTTQFLVIIGLSLLLVCILFLLYVGSKLENFKR